MHIKTPNLIKFILFLVVFSCKTKEIKNKNPEIIIEQNKTITKELYNSDKTLLLILNYKEVLASSKKINFKVVDVKTKKTIMEDIFTGMKLEWRTNSSLIGYLHVGITTKESENPEEIIKENENNFKIIKINTNN